MDWDINEDVYYVIIKEAGSGDAGSYTVTATNAHGSVKATSKVTVTAPKVEEQEPVEEAVKPVEAKPAQEQPEVTKETTTEEEETEVETEPEVAEVAEADKKESASQESVTEEETQEETEVRGQMMSS